MATRFVTAIVLALLVGTSTAHATCGWFGTQFECGLGASRLVIGTQVADDPGHATSLRPSAFQGREHPVEDRAPAAAPFRLELQNVGTDPTLCHRFGNESYCY